MAYWRVCVLLTWAFGAAAVTPDRIAARNHRYKQGDEIALYANVVGPFMNPTETYEYYSLPYCQPPGGPAHKALTLGEALGGHRLVGTPYRLPFRTDVENAVLCRAVLSREQLQVFRDAMDKDYFFQYFYDDLSAMGLVGMVVDAQGRLPQPLLATASLPADRRRHFLITHLTFDFSFHGDSVIELNVSSHPSRMTEITAAADRASGGGGGEAVGAGGGGGSVSVTFTYSARWRETEVPFSRRMERWTQFASRPEMLQFHWAALQRSWTTTLALAAALAALLAARALLCGVRSWLLTRGPGRHLLFRPWRPSCKQSGAAAAASANVAEPKEDSVLQHVFAKQQARGDAVLTSEDWRCRGQPSAAAAPPPRHAALLAAMVGLGVQMLAVAGGAFALALSGAFRPFDRGRLSVALLVLYAFTPGIATYVSELLRSNFGGFTHWRRGALMCVALYSGPAALVFFALNAAAAAHGWAVAVPVRGIAHIALLWVLVAAPLTVLGAVAARRRGARPGGLFRATKPAAGHHANPAYHSWLRRCCAIGCWIVQVAAAGGLGLWVGYVEVYYVLGSAWGYKLYILYPILSIMFALQLAITALGTVVLTFCQLSTEDRSWRWRSFLVGGSTGLSLYGFCALYYVNRSGMSGALQAAFFFGYTGLGCYAAFLALGAVGFGAAALFVRWCCGGYGSAGADGGVDAARACDTQHEAAGTAAEGVMVIRSRKTQPLIN